MRLIDADALRKSVLDLPNCYNGFSDTFDKSCIIGLIDEQPTADVHPNVRGEWKVDGIEQGFAFDHYTCSICGYVSGIKSTNFCPNCGADMRGEQDG